MAQSYIGIVTRKGLESLILEPDAEQSAPRYWSDGRPPGSYFCCWAVLQREIARDLQRQLRDERYHEALVLLNAEAQFCGTFLPPINPDELFVQR